LERLPFVDLACPGVNRLANLPNLIEFKVIIGGEPSSLAARGFG
jgi:hypothetical protein